MSKTGGKDGVALLARALQRLLPRLAASNGSDHGLRTWSSTGMELGLPPLPGWGGSDPLLSASLADLDRAAAAILAPNKRLHAGGRRRLHWDEIRDAYDAIPAEKLSRFDTDAALFRCLQRKLTQDGIIVSDDTIGRALAEHRILRKT